jgi:hypothetical protein
LSSKRAKSLKSITTLGRYFLMVYFGTKFATIVMLRVSNYIGRLTFLLYDWLGLG